MPKRPEEWFRQADYDLKTAQVLYENGRYIHAVFMCHLCIEKALKGLFSKKLDAMPPRSHNLIFLSEKVGLEVPLALSDWFFNLNRLSVPTRYPDDLYEMTGFYNKDMVKEMLGKSEETLQWLKTEL